MTDLNKAMEKVSLGDRIYHVCTATGLEGEAAKGTQEAPCQSLAQAMVMAALQAAAPPRRPASADGRP